MFKQFGEWLDGKDEAEEEDDRQKLREISLEYKEADLKAATQGLHASRRLGSGNYGTVYRGTLADGHDVAIKVLDVEDDDEATAACGFADEVRVLSKFRHPHLVTLMGWGMGKAEAPDKQRFFLIYELLSGGDVSQRLALCRGDGGRPFTWEERLWVALDAACGLSHMHNSTPKAFHRDIKSANILLDRSGTAKMADFGLSGIAKHKDKLNMTCQQISGTPGYACPHYIKSGQVTEETEVYAFGMVTMELLLNSMPACLGQNGNIMFPIFQVVVPTKPGALERALKAVDVKASWPPDLAKELAEFALKCSAQEQESRPRFTEVGRRLRQFREQHCKENRCAPSTDPRLVTPADAGPATSPQMHPGAGGGAPTQPQLAAGGAMGGSAATRPQLGGHGLQPPGPSGLAGVGGDMPTRPQLPGASGAAGGGMPTRPQLPGGAPGGPPGALATRPQMGMGAPAGGAPMQPQLPGAPGGGGAPTRPQLPGAGGYPQPGVLGAGLPARAAVGASPCRWLEIAKGMLDSGHAGAWSLDELADMVLECTKAPPGMNLAGLPLAKRCLTFRAEACPWSVGRQDQPDLFCGLVPDENLRTCISRSHFTLSWLKVGLRLKKLSPNTLLVNGTPAPPSQEVVLKNGGEIGFCGKDNITTFLTFTVFFRDRSSAAPQQQQRQEQQPQQQPQPQQHQQPATQPQAQAAPSPQKWWCTGPAPPYSLVCVLAFNHDVGKLPPEAKTVHLQDDGFSIGRVHQPGFFEGLLEERAPKYLSFISRSHLALTPDRRERGCFQVDNQSANPVRLGGRAQLDKGDSGTIRPGESIEFLGNTPDDAKCVNILQLRLEDSLSSQFHGAGAPLPTAPQVHGDTQGPLPTAPQVHGARALLPTNPQGDSVAAPLATKPQVQFHVSPDAPRFHTQAGAYGAEMPTAPQLSSQAASQPSRSGGGHSSSSSPACTLRLSGSTVLRNFPVESRELQDDGEGSITVGRAHQPALHQCAFEQEMRQWLSRDHFRVERCYGGYDGQFRLVPLSSNPIWRRRGRKLDEAFMGEPMLCLENGDEIVLYTGADDCTVDGPGSCGSLFWAFQCSSHGIAEEEEDDLDGPTRMVPAMKAGGGRGRGAAATSAARAPAYNHNPTQPAFKPGQDPVGSIVFR